jgi:glycosyltransferase involved in cell wall biosynthesis
MDVLRGADIFHANYFPLPDKSLFDKNTRRFMTVYDLIPLRYPGVVADPTVFRTALKSIQPDDMIIAISESTKADICQMLAIDESRVFVTHLAADEMLFRPCNDQQLIATTLQKYKIPSTPYILCTCTMAPHKNLDRLIRCFSRLVQQEKIGDLQLVLVGPQGWQSERIRAELDAAGVAAKQIRFAGYVEDEDLAPIYSGAEFFVYPSLYEGFGLTPLEAMQCGTPVVCSKSSSLPEVVGDAGLTFNPLDDDEMCQAMLSAHNDENLRKKMSLSSKAQAAKFTWRRFAKETLDAYRH